MPEYNNKIIFYLENWETAFLDRARACRTNKGGA
jgi:hypothetical protein